MLHIKTEQLTQEQTEVQGLIQAIEAAKIFDFDQLVNSQEFVFAKDSRLPFLGQLGIIESVERFTTLNIPNVWIDEDAEASKAVIRYLQPLRGAVNGMYLTSQYAMVEQVDGNGVETLIIDPFALTIRGKYERYGIFRDNTFEGFNHEKSVRVAHTRLDSFVGLLPKVAGVIAA